MSLRNDIERELGTRVRVRAGAPGSLNVIVDGERIFSRQQAGRPPIPAEIVRLMRERPASVIGQRFGFSMTSASSLPPASNNSTWVRGSAASLAATAQPDYLRRKRRNRTSWVVLKRLFAGPRVLATRTFLASCWSPVLKEPLSRKRSTNVLIYLDGRSNRKFV